MFFYGVTCNQETACLGSAYKLSRDALPLEVECKHRRKMAKCASMNLRVGELHSLLVSFTLKTILRIFIFILFFVDYSLF